MAYLGACILVVGFLLFMKIFGLVSKSIRVIDTTKKAVSDLQNTELNDDAKEELMQSHSKQLFVLFALITLGSATAIALPTGLIVLIEIMGMLSLDDSLTALISWKFLVPSSLITAVVIGMSTKK